MSEKPAEPNTLARWIIWSVIVAAVGGLIATAGWQWWTNRHPSQQTANVVVFDWRGYNADATNPARADIQLSNDGNGSAQVCRAYWMDGQPGTTLASPLGSSHEFGLAPGERTELEIVQTPPVSDLLGSTLATESEAETYVYVTCGSTRFTDSAPINITVQTF
ncbi:MAG TPA: hypothetical protein VH333_05805 [Pseudonocardiaceae bacterium]|jgi:hypothetical protein|nr:hypothetical protein [Pseudonocardiaceae bacterium]